MVNKRSANNFFFNFVLFFYPTEEAVSGDEVILYEVVEPALELAGPEQIQRSGGIRDRVIGDKKAVLQKVLPWVTGDTSDFGKRFANQNRRLQFVVFTKIHIR